MFVYILAVSTEVRQRCWERRPSPAAPEVLLGRGKENWETWAAPVRSVVQTQGWWRAWTRSSVWCECGLSGSRSQHLLCHREGSLTLAPWGQKKWAFLQHLEQVCACKGGGMSWSHHPPEKGTVPYPYAELVPCCWRSVVTAWQLGLPPIQSPAAFNHQPGGSGNTCNDAVVLVLVFLFVGAAVFSPLCAVLQRGNIKARCERLSSMSITQGKPCHRQTLSPCVRMSGLWLWFWTIPFSGCVLCWLGLLFHFHSSRVRGFPTSYWADTFWGQEACTTLSAVLDQGPLHCAWRVAAGMGKMTPVLWM